MSRRPRTQPFYDEEPVIARSNKYHREWCSAVALIGPAQRRLRSYKEAQELGLEPCRICKPYPYGLQAIAGRMRLRKEMAEDAQLEHEEQLEERLQRAIEHLDPGRACPERAATDSPAESFAEVVATLQAIARRLEILPDEEPGVGRLLATLRRRTRANFPDWLLAMLRFVWRTSRRLERPKREDPVTKLQLEAFFACLGAFDEWADRWGLRQKQ
ncbi:MAG: hypothetical protein RMI94_00300 [Bryobacterales bacterium]|nr:hypothetical protein [Bryobacteraceae bacterium]MDW8128960.1 hypothetical protein [Bryobacterales bacterium]